MALKVSFYGDYGELLRWHKTASLRPSDEASMIWISHFRTDYRCAPWLRNCGGG